MSMLKSCMSPMSLCFWTVLFFIFAVTLNMMMSMSKDMPMMMSVDMMTLAKAVEAFSVLTLVFATLLVMTKGYAMVKSL